MPVATTTDFIETLRKSGLLDAQELDSALAAYPGSLDDTNKLIEHLIDNKTITKFQAKSLLAGRYRGLIIGPYKILDRIGAGGMGIVYLAQHMKLDRRVAIKVLPEDKTKDKLALERFYREARAVAALDHPNIVKAFDVAEHEGLHYFVMEYIDGANLQRYIDTKGPLPWKTAVNVAMQACKGLQQAHERGLVHRDIKPANILVDKSGQVKILDLGLARSFDEKKDNLTQDLSDGKDVMGSIDYISPEQAIANRPVDIRADIYSLGATLYALIAGRPPVEGTTAQKLLQHQVQMPTPVHKVKPDVPEGISTVMAKMMAKKPEHRYTTPADVITAFTPFVANTPQLFPQLGQTQFGMMPPTGPITGPTSGPMGQMSGPMPTAPLLRDPPTKPRTGPIESKRDTDRIKGKTKKFKSKKGRKKEGSKTLFIVICTAAVLIPVMGIIFIFARNNSTSEVVATANNPPSPRQETSPAPPKLQMQPEEKAAPGKTLQQNPSPPSGTPDPNTPPPVTTDPRTGRPREPRKSPAKPNDRSIPIPPGGGPLRPGPGSSGTGTTTAPGGQGTTPPQDTAPPRVGGAPANPGSTAPGSTPPGGGGQSGLAVPPPPTEGGTSAPASGGTPPSLSLGPTSGSGTPPGARPGGTPRTPYPPLTANFKVVEGQPMADLAGDDWEELGMRLSEFEGKVVILDIYNFATSSAVRMFPFKKQLHERFKDRAFAYVGVNTEPNKGEYERGMRQHKLPWRNFKNTLADKSTITRRLGVQQYPSLIVIDHRGIVRHIYVGPIRNTVEFESQIEKLVESAEKNQKPG
jgi:serine/threonine protein kinase